MSRLSGVLGCMAAVAASLCVLSSPALAMTVDLAADATQSAPNDQFDVVAVAEASGDSPASVSATVNRRMAAALAAARAYPRVQVRTGSTQTYPIYGKDGRIGGWRMRSELLLQSQDATAVSELTGVWQGTLGIVRFQAQPSSQTRARAENSATLAAIAAFRAKAQAIAGVFGKPYRIKQLTVGGQFQTHPPLARAMLAAVAASPAPLEAGESEVGVTVTGQILIDEPETQR